MKNNEILSYFDDINAGSTNGPANNPISGQEMTKTSKNIPTIFTGDEDGGRKFARYFDPAGFAPSQFDMSHLRTGLGVPVDLFELDNLAHPTSEKYESPQVVCKRGACCACLQTPGEEHLQTLAGYQAHLSLILGS